MDKYINFIRKKLTTRELLEQLAEECNELGKISLKLIRAGGLSNNTTPLNFYNAMIDFTEEQLDVVSVLWLLTGNKDYEYIKNYPKFERWARRLGYKE